VLEEAGKGACREHHGVDGGNRATNLRTFGDILRTETRKFPARLSKCLFKLLFDEQSLHADVRAPLATFHGQLQGALLLLLEDLVNGEFECFEENVLDVGAPP